MNNKSIAVICMALVCSLMISCVPQEKVRYMQDPQGAVPKSYFENKIPDYKVQPGDYLFIRLFTMDKETNDVYAGMNGSGQYSSNNEQGIYLNSYQVNDSGLINFPLLGKIKAGGLDIQEIERQIHDLMLKEIANPGVIVRLVNFRVTVLGEVKNPGTFSINQSCITIFEAFSLADDLTTYSNRNAVKLLRKIDGNTMVYTLDLTKKDILSSEFYYLRPGDILYVEPLKNKQFAFESFPYSLILSSLSTVLALMTFFKF
ncbi:MAG: polysaccharide export protein [Bacteroidetes bacterium]|nr:polysaccharide export protein [Bacteroidota bacterium]